MASIRGSGAVGTKAPPISAGCGHDRADQGPMIMGGYNHLVVQLRLAGPDGERTVQRVITLDQVVTGVRHYPVVAN